MITYTNRAYLIWDIKKKQGKEFLKQYSKASALIVNYIQKYSDKGLHRSCYTEIYTVTKLLNIYIQKTNFSSTSVIDMCKYNENKNF